MPGDPSNKRSRLNYFGENIDDNRPRSGTAARDSTGHVVPGEYNNATGKPIGTQPGNRPMGLSSDAEWARSFPYSPTGQRMRSSVAGTMTDVQRMTDQASRTSSAPAAGGGPAWATPPRPSGAPRPLAGQVMNRPIWASNGEMVDAGGAVHYDPSKDQKTRALWATQPTRAGESKAFQTPYGRVAVGGAHRVAANVASLAPSPAAAAPAPAASAITPASPTNIGPAVGAPPATAAAPAAPQRPWWEGPVKSATGLARRVGSAAAAPIAPLIRGAQGVAQGVQAARPLWAPAVNEAQRQLTPGPVQAANAGGAVWAALPEHIRQRTAGTARVLGGAAVRNALPGPLGPLWTLGQARKKATPINRPEAQPTY